jgi:glycosyltransferase involved in cell wall biosynthesis
MHCEVGVLSAAESELDYSIKVARSKSYKDMLLALINPMVHLRIFQAIRRLRPDVIYIISPHMLNAAIVIFYRLFTRIPIISHIHDPAHYSHPLVATTVNSISWLQARLSNRVYCWGNTIKEVICAKFGVASERVQVFKHGPGQTTYFDLHATDERNAGLKYFSLIGGMQARKGIEFFLEAAARFNHLYGKDEVHFLLAGSGNLDAYRGRMNALPNLVVENRFIGNDEVNEFLAESYALVLPYIGGVLQSSFVAIAYGNGCPVIVSRLGSLPEEVDEGSTGFVVDRANVEQITAAMHAIYSGDTRSLFSRNCIEAYREKFSWDCIGEEFYRDMARLAGQPAQSSVPAQEAHPGRG